MTTTPNHNTGRNRWSGALTGTLAVLAGQMLIAAPVAAQTTGCAGAGDLRAGITLTYSDGVTETYRSAGPGVTTVQAMDGAQPLYRLEISQGTHLLDYVEYDGAAINEQTRQVYDYGQPPETLPVPENGGRFTPTVTVTSSVDGVRTETQAQAYIAGDALVVEGCSYETIDAVIAYLTDDNYIESITYLPQLGIGFLAWSETDNGRSDDSVVVSIRTGK